MMWALSESARAKAIEIADLLVEVGMDEAHALEVSVVKAKEWAAQRGIPMYRVPNEGTGQIHTRTKWPEARPQSSRARARRPMPGV